MAYEVARSRMVREQIAGRGIISKPVLRAMRAVPRHLFVDQAFWPRAYSDHALPIGNDQTISQPYIVGRMCQELELSGPGLKILEIGTGSGYQTAVLAAMGHFVFTIERHESLAARAKAVLKKLGISSVTYLTGDGSLGWPEEAPFQGIVVTAGAPVIPEDLVSQLDIGARLVIPVGGRDGQRLTIVEKHENGIETRNAGDCAFVPLIGRKGWESA